MAGAFDELSRFREQHEQARFDFMRTDLDLSQTLIGVAEQEQKSGNREHAEQALLKAEVAYGTIRDLSNKPEQSLTDAHRAEIEAKLNAVRGALDQARRMIRG